MVRRHYVCQKIDSSCVVAIAHVLGRSLISYLLFSCVSTLSLNEKEFVQLLALVCF